MTDKKSNDSRRKLLKSIAAGSGAVVAGKSLPESWSKPVVDSVMLPAHAETSPTETRAVQFNKTLGYDLPYSWPDYYVIPDQTFTFAIGSIVPTGDGQVDITNLVGDVGEEGSYWIIRIGTTLLGQTNQGVPNPTPGTNSVAPNSQWAVPLASLQAALSGGAIIITAENYDSAIESFTPTSTMDVTLSFPGEVPA